MPLTTAYLRDIVADIDTSTLPAGSLDGSWTSRNNGDTAANAKSLLAASGPAAGEINWAVGSQVWGGSSTFKPHTAQFLSETLAAQSVSAGNWTIAFTGSPSSVQAGSSWAGWAALKLVNGATGAVRTNIFSGQAIGSTGRTSSAIRTCYSTTISGGAFSPQAGDYLCLEIGVTFTTRAGGETASIRSRGNGATAISSDNVANTDAQSFITAPSSIAYTSDGAAGAALAGQSDGTSSTSATGLTQTQPLAGTTTGTSSATATGLKQTQPLAGGSAGGSTATGTLTAIQLVAGSAAGTSSASGSLSTSVALAGSATGTSSVIGNLSTAKPLAGVSQGTSSATGDLTDHPAAILAGSSAGASSTTGNLSPSVFLAGQSEGGSSVVGNLIPAASLYGTSQGTSSATGTGLTQTQPLAGQSDGASTITGILTAIQNVAGQSDGGSSVSGSLALRAALAGVSAGGSLADGALSTQYALFGSSVGGSSVVGSLALRVTLTQATGGVATLTPTKAIYSDGESAILLAAPSPGYSFVFWTINGQRFHVNPLAINIHQDLRVQPYFALTVPLTPAPLGVARCPFCGGGDPCPVCGGSGWVRA
jgi:hypothetical protein